MKVRRSRGVIFVGLAAALGIAVLAGSTIDPSVMGSTATDIPPSPFESLKADMLATNGIELRSPDGGEAAVGRAVLSEEQAIDRAMTKMAPGSRALETKLVEYTDKYTNPPFTCLCWIVVSEPAGGIFVSGGPGGSRQSSDPDAIIATLADPYHFDVIDATTGEWLGAREGARRMLP